MLKVEVKNKTYKISKNNQLKNVNKSSSTAKINIHLTNTLQCMVSFKTKKKYC